MSDVHPVDVDHPSPDLPQGIRTLVTHDHALVPKHPVLEAAAHQFCQTLPLVFKTLLPESMEIQLATFESMRLAGFLSHLQASCWSTLISIGSWGGTALMVMEGHFFYAIIDRALGGTTTLQDTFLQKQSFTSIERNLAERFIHKIVGCFNQTFRRAHLSFQVVRHETSNHLLSIVHPQSSVLVLRFEGTLGQHQGNLYLMLPYATLEPVLETLNMPYHGDEDEPTKVVWTHHLQEHTSQATSTLTAVMDQRTLSLGQVMHWKVGETLFKDIPLEPTIQVYVNQHLFGHAEADHTHLKRVVTLKEVF